MKETTTTNKTNTSKQSKHKNNNNEITRHPVNPANSFTRCFLKSLIGTGLRCDDGDGDGDGNVKKAID